MDGFDCLYLNYKRDQYGNAYCSPVAKPVVFLIDRRKKVRIIGFQEKLRTQQLGSKMTFGELEIFDQIEADDTAWDE